MEQVVVLVGPEYDLNVGMVARVMKNFGLEELRLVKPACPLGRKAVIITVIGTDGSMRSRCTIGH